MQVESKHCEMQANEKNSYLKLTPKTKLDACISSIVKNEGYISCNINQKEISTNGGNYLGVLREVNVKGKTTDGEKETAIFVKSMAFDGENLKTLSMPDVYKAELFVYKELSKVFNKLQEDAKVPIGERYEIVKCYDESYDEAIFLENVTRRGFKTWHRMDIVTLDMAEMCIKQLARFHGLSFVLKEKTPDYFNSTLKSLKTKFKFGEAWNEMVKNCCNLSLEHLETDLRNRVEDKLPHILQKFQEYIEDESIMYCLCHGDYRSNNVMVQEENGRVVEAIPVDYQLICYGCPIMDFYYFMYTGTDYQFRKSHMLYLKNLYYETLDQFLQHFDTSAESVLPRKKFENFYRDKVDYGLMTLVIFGPFIFASEDDFPDVTKEAAVKINFKVDERFRDRLKGVIEEFSELGYF